MMAPLEDREAVSRAHHMMVAEIAEGSICGLVGRDGQALAGAGDRDDQPVEAG